MKKILTLFFCVIILIIGCAVPFHKKSDQYLTADQYKEADELIESEKNKPQGEYKVFEIYLNPRKKKIVPIYMFQ